MGLLGLGGAGARAEPASERRHQTPSSGAPARATARRSATTARSAKSRWTVLVKGNLQDMLLSADIDRLLGLEGCLAGKVPAAGLPHEGGVQRPLRPARPAGHRQGRDRPWHVRQRGGRTDRRAAHHAGQPGRERGGAERTRRAATWRSRRAAATPKLTRLAEEAGKITRERYAQQLELLGAAVRDQRAAHAQRPELRLHARVRQHREAAGHPQAALCLPLPRTRSGADLRAHEGGA